PATVTLAGTVATPVLLLESDTTAPPLGAALVRVAVPVAEPPPVTMDGLRLIALKLAGGGTGLTVSVAARVVAPCAPVIVTAVDVATELVVVAKLALVTPAATVTLGGTVATAFELERVTRSPPLGAAAVSVTVPVEPFPPTTLLGFTDTDDNDAVVGAACGVKRWVAENGPKTPAELLARTRHQRRLAGRAPIVACGTVAVPPRTNGRANG